MTTEAQYIKSYFANLQTKRPQVSGTVASVSYDATTGRQSRIMVSAGGSTILVPLSETTPPLAQSDRVVLEQIGTAANAQYRIADAYGARPSAGMTQFYGDSTVGGNAVASGDILIGGTGASDPNFFYDFSAGIWQARTGATVNGSWASDGTIISGNVTGSNVQISSTGIKMYSVGGTEALQRVWIKPDGSGWMAGSTKFAWDTAGNVSLAGAITATSGSITGFLTLGASGGIYQGTYESGHAGDAAYPETGLKIWNDSGVGRLATYNTHVAQVYFGSDGKFYAGAGKVSVNANGIELLTSGEDDRYLKVYNSEITTYTSAAGFINLQKTAPDTNTYGVMNFGLRHDANHQSGIACWLHEVDITIQNGAATWRSVMEANWDFINLNVPLKLTAGSAPTCTTGEAFIYMRSGALYYKCNDDTEHAI